MVPSPLWKPPMQCYKLISKSMIIGYLTIDKLMESPGYGLELKAVRTMCPIIWYLKACWLCNRGSLHLISNYWPKRKWRVGHSTCPFFRKTLCLLICWSTLSQLYCFHCLLVCYSPYFSIWQFWRKNRNLYKWCGWMGWQCGSIGASILCSILPSV